MEQVEYNNYVLCLKQLETELRQLYVKPYILPKTSGPEELKKFIVNKQIQQLNVKEQIAQLQTKIANLYIACNQELLNTFTEKEQQAIQLGLKSLMERSEAMDSLLKKIQKVKILYPTWELAALHKVTKSAQYSVSFRSPEDIYFTCSFPFLC